MSLVLGSLSTNQTVAAALIAVVGEQIVPALVEKVCEWGAAAFSSLNNAFTLPQVAGHPHPFIQEVRKELEGLQNATRDATKELDEKRITTQRIFNQLSQEEQKQKIKTQNYESAISAHKRLTAEMLNNKTDRNAIQQLELCLQLIKQNAKTEEDVTTIQELHKRWVDSVQEERLLQIRINKLQFQIEGKQLLLKDEL